MEPSPLYHNTRPEGELLPQEAAAFDLLERLGIDYDRVSGEPADTMEKCAAVSAVLGVPICKNLFLCNRQKTQFYLLCMEPDKPFHTKDLSRQIGSARLSFAPEEALPAARLAAELEHVRLRGLMCIPPAAEKSGENRPFFAKLRRLAVDISLEMGDNKADNLWLSMGMSGDYEDAVAEGADFVRLGTALFGPRPPLHPTAEHL